MRGETTLLSMQLPADYAGGNQTAAPSYADSAQAANSGGDNIAQNTKLAQTPGSLYWLLILTALYGIWGYWQNKNATEAFSPGEMRINLINFFKVTITVAIGFNLINVFLTKLSAMRLPLLSKLAGTFLPFFSI